MLPESDWAHSDPRDNFDEMRLEIDGKSSEMAMSSIHVRSLFSLLYILSILSLSLLSSLSFLSGGGNMFPRPQLPCIQTFSPVDLQHSPSIAPA